MTFTRCDQWQKGIVCWIVIGAVLALVNTSAPANDLPLSLGPLNEHVFLGTDGPWEATVQGDRYVLHNVTQEGVIKYFYTGFDREDRTVSCHVYVAGDEGSGAGILYAYHEDPLLYYFFILHPDGMVSLYRRDIDGFQQLFSLSGGYVLLGEENELRIEERGNTFALLVNGTEIASIDSVNTGTGALGVIAVGTGRFTFGDFGLENAHETS